MRIVDGHSVTRSCRVATGAAALPFRLPRKSGRCRFWNASEILHSKSDLEVGYGKGSSSPPSKFIFLSAMYSDALHKKAARSHECITCSVVTHQSANYSWTCSRDPVVTPMSGVISYFFIRFLTLTDWVKDMYNVIVDVFSLINICLVECYSYACFGTVGLDHLTRENPSPI